MPFLGNIGTGELLIIGIVLFLMFGGKKMNEVAKGLGQSSKEFKRIKKEMDKTLKQEETSKEKAG
ncbi:hypothetical protein A3C59_04215 [Candidatus Daviesbacteria bacterium RIFCSPHIGHO2_02_FULL_36_13]|uniref:Sec-independent protein translocase protein TatA n=1 Tax=Candidatus Daviesbacteria bacterium RIFCSPHIGHO2_02_FULL_36_13 TaxID=1797768 RepID=A0A1F5JUB4_9BACT|nr:MAG: hypothetical protein A3C59_04215 [Candidatus Daviesbacteria bacterium RIFCSPHIGHO2_02_FULL_36_13]